VRSIEIVSREIIFVTRTVKDEVARRASGTWPSDRIENENSSVKKYEAKCLRANVFANLLNHLQIGLREFWDASFTDISNKIAWRSKPFIQTPHQTFGTKTNGYRRSRDFIGNLRASHLRRRE